VRGRRVRWAAVRKDEGLWNMWDLEAARWDCGGTFRHEGECNDGCEAREYNVVYRVVLICVESRRRVSGHKHESGGKCGRTVFSDVESD